MAWIFQALAGLVVWLPAGIPGPREGSPLASGKTNHQSQANKAGYNKYEASL